MIPSSTLPSITAHPFRDTLCPASPRIFNGQWDQLQRETLRLSRVRRTLLPFPWAAPVRERSRSTTTESYARQRLPVLQVLLETLCSGVPMAASFLQSLASPTTLVTNSLRVTSRSLPCP